MRIAICDDDIQELATISTIIEAFKYKHCNSLTYEVFNNPQSLLNKVIDESFDFLLLDVIMPQMTGIELATTIRTFNKNIPIAFLTTSPEFAIASYRVHAKDYLLKPINEDLLFELLLQYTKSSEDFLIVKTTDGVVQVQFSDIVSIEIIARKICISLVDKSVLQAFGTLSEYEERLLGYAQFYKPHRSFLVNLSHIKKIDRDGVHTILGNIIPIPKQNVANTKNAYMNYLMQ